MSKHSTRLRGEHFWRSYKLRAVQMMTFVLSDFLISNTKLKVTINELVKKTRWHMLGHVLAS